MDFSPESSLKSNVGTMILFTEWENKQTFQQKNKQKDFLSCQHIHPFI